MVRTIRAPAFIARISSSMEERRPALARSHLLSKTVSAWRNWFRAAELAKRSEAVGVRDCDDRIDPHELAKLRAQRGEHDRLWVCNASALDRQVIDLFGALQYLKDGIEEVVID